MFSFVCTICESILEADCVVDEPNTFEEDPQDMFEQDNDAQRVQTITQAAAKYLKTDEQRAAFMDELKKMAAADSTTPFEAVALSMLENLL